MYVLFMRVYVFTYSFVVCMSSTAAAARTGPHNAASFFVFAGAVNIKWTRIMNS